MKLFDILKTAIVLILKRDFREFYIRTLIALGQIDLKTITIDQLNLSLEQAHSYSDSGREHLQNVLNSLDIKQGDAVVDLGCGKGGALITLSEYNFSKISGVEISAELIRIAKKNLERLKVRNVEFFCCDAKNFQWFDNYNYVYLYNPFPCSVMLDVIENLSLSIKRKPRKVTMIYLNPECHKTIIDHGVFQKVNEFSHSSHEFYIYSN